MNSDLDPNIGLNINYRAVELNIGLEKIVLQWIRAHIKVRILVRRGG